MMMPIVQATPILESSEVPPKIARPDLDEEGESGEEESIEQDSSKPETTPSAKEDQSKADAKDDVKRKRILHDHNCSGLVLF